jgi:Transposase
VVCNPRKNALLKDGNKSDRIDARKLAELLRLDHLKPVYHGETGVRMLRELARSYLTLVKDLTRVMNRLKALYRSWAIPCAGRDCWPRVASMPSPPGYDRFRRWARFAPPSQ